MRLCAIAYMLSRMHTAALVRTAREGANLTQSELASRAGMAQSVIARMEQPGANPTLRSIQRALSAAGCELNVVPLRPSMIDEAQLRERLRLTPAERLRLFQASHHNVLRLVDRARRVDR